MNALAVNTSVNQFARPADADDNTDMYRKRRETPLGRLIESRPGLSDNALARLLKVPQPTITRLANGTTKEPGRDLVRKLAAYFGVSDEEIVGGTPPASKRMPKVATGKFVSTGSGRAVPVPGADLSPAALDVARAWSKLSAVRQAEFRDAMFWAACVEAKYPAFKGKPVAESLEKFERIVEADFARRYKERAA